MYFILTKILPETAKKGMDKNNWILNIGDRPCLTFLMLRLKLTWIIRGKKFQVSRQIKIVF